MTRHMRNYPCSILVALCALGAARPAMAQAVRYVDNVAACAGLAPCHPTIMEAVTAAEPSDTIEVFPGVYAESFRILNKPGLVLKAHREEIMPVIVSRLTIEGSSGIQILHFVLTGSVEVYGSFGSVFQGNLLRNSSIYFTYCGSRIEGNTFLGGGIGASTARDCVVVGNTLTNGGIFLGQLPNAAVGNSISQNVVHGSIYISGEQVQFNNIVSNHVDGGGISIGGGAPRMNSNSIRNNVVRGGGISLGGGGVGGSSVVSNLVSGNTGDGISIRNTDTFGGRVVVRLNTSVENGGCDVRDTSPPWNSNVWEMNRFGTRCGTVTQ
jgi:hypothetical protein